jgi:hypothetical protein
MAIPKTIHYCWLSEDSYPELVLRCQKSWQRHLPHYHLQLWNTKTFDIHAHPWVSEAVQQKKWAFAADYIRLYALYHQGGIYLDCDVEILKPLNPLLPLPFFFGFENGSHRIEAAVMGAEAGNPLIGQCLEFYKDHHFIYQENSVDSIVLPKLMQSALKRKGIVLQEIHSINNFKYDEGIIPVFSQRFFSPKNYLNGQIEHSQDSFCIHHFESSWRAPYVQEMINKRRHYYQKYPYIIAKGLTYRMSLKKNVMELGISGTLKKLLQKIFHH